MSTRTAALHRALLASNHEGLQLADEIRGARLALAATRLWRGYGATCVHVNRLATGAVLHAAAATAGGRSTSHSRNVRPSTRSWMTRPHESTSHR